MGVKTIWHWFRLRCPDPVKVAVRRLRSVLIDPFGRGVPSEVSGVSVVVPGYFVGGGRATYEAASAARVMDWLASHPSGILIDVGCSVSTYGLIALCTSRQSRVVAIDPDFASLLWSRFFCSKAVHPERLRLVHGFVVAAPQSPQDVDAAAGHLAREIARRGSDPFRLSTKYQDGSDPLNREVPRHSLDALFEREEAAGGMLIKVDVEGHELGVLGGARGLIARTQPVMLLSVHPQFGVDVGEVRRFLEGAGYTGEHFASDHEEHWWCVPAGRPVS
jgi:FkbM family methyltransferase